MDGVGVGTGSGRGVGPGVGCRRATWTWQLWQLFWRSLQEERDADCFTRYLRSPVRTSVCSFVRPCARPSVRPTICLSVLPSLRSTVCPSVCSTVHPFVVARPSIRYVQHTSVSIWRLFTSPFLTGNFAGCWTHHWDGWIIILNFCFTSVWSFTIIYYFVLLWTLSNDIDKMNTPLYCCEYCY